jgi:hypothetical protein
MLRRLSVGQPSQPVCLLLSPISPTSWPLPHPLLLPPLPSSAPLICSPHPPTTSTSTSPTTLSTSSSDGTPPEINAALAVTNPDWADVGWGSPVPAPDLTWNLNDDFNAVFPPLPSIAIHPPPDPLTLLAQVAPSPDPAHPAPIPAPIPALITATRRSLSPVLSEAELPPYSERPRPAERVL